MAALFPNNLDLPSLPFNSLSSLFFSVTILDVWVANYIKCRSTEILFSQFLPTFLSLSLSDNLSWTKVINLWGFMGGREHFPLPAERPTSGAGSGTVRSCCFPMRGKPRRMCCRSASSNEPPKRPATAKKPPRNGAWTWKFSLWNMAFDWQICTNGKTLYICLCEPNDKFCKYF